jgi:flagellar biogenesis protein FliO
MSARPPSNVRCRAKSILLTASGMALLSHATASFAAESAPLTQGDDVITGAGIVRVIVAFVLVAALGVAAIAMLRRFLPRFAGSPLASGTLRVVERTSLGPATRVHVVQVDDERILVAETRGALAMVVLGRSNGPSQP